MRKQGFTLIELLVVIAIIAILAAILFPVFAGARERARVTKCMNGLKNLSLAMRMYCDDHSGTMPGALASHSYPRVDWIGTGDLTDVSQGQLWGYVRNRETYLCPTDKAIAKAKYNKETSYSMNAQLGCIYGSSDRHAMKLDAETAGRTSKILLFIHERIDRINDGYFAWGNNWDIPSDVHYDGTTLVYVDGHAKWAGYKQLVAEMQTGQWKRNSVYYR